MGLPGDERRGAGGGGAAQAPRAEHGARPPGAAPAPATPCAWQLERGGALTGLLGRQRPGRPLLRGGGGGGRAAAAATGRAAGGGKPRAAAAGPGRFASIAAASLAGGDARKFSADGLQAVPAGVVEGAPTAGGPLHLLAAARLRSRCPAVPCPPPRRRPLQARR